jgi:CRISPR-associated protein Csx16
MEVKWSDKMKNRSRVPFLIVVDGGNAQFFEGQPISRRLAIAGSQYRKNGKWSGTDYVLVPAKNVALVEFCQPFEGWGKTWKDLSRSLSVLHGDIDKEWLLRKLGDGAKDGTLFGRAVQMAKENEEIMQDVQSGMKTIIVTRHLGALEWLRKHHPELGEAKVVSHASPDDLQGNRVIGVLPVNLAALCAEYWHLSMQVPPEARGKELSAEEMEQFGCSIERFIVRTT